MKNPVIKTIKCNYYTFDAIDFIKNNLNGEICHTTSEKNFKGIFKDKIIHPSDIRFGSKMFHYNSVGYNENCVCLCDFRNLNKNEDFLKTISECMTFNYILLLKNSEFKNILLPKSEDEIRYNLDKGYGVPLYECWYKGDLLLNKIKKILHIDFYNKNIADENIVNEVMNYLDY